MTILERFLDKIEIDSESNCWEWTGCTDGRYGIFHFPNFYKGYRMAKAHHVSLFLLEGVGVGEGLCVLHSCDNTICCNPEHLSIGSHLDNMEDMSRKGRAVGSPKLSHEGVEEARYLRSQGFSVKSIAEKFNLSSSQMSRVVKGCFRKGARGVDL